MTPVELDQARVEIEASANRVASKRNTQRPVTSACAVPRRNTPGADTPPKVQFDFGKPAANKP